jgi:hypothetical protein
MPCAVPPLPSPPLTERQRYLLATPDDPRCERLEQDILARAFPRFGHMVTGSWADALEPRPGRLKRAWRTLVRVLLGIE